MYTTITHLAIIGTIIGIYLPSSIEIHLMLDRAYKEVEDDNLVPTISKEVFQGISIIISIIMISLICWIMLAYCNFVYYLVHNNNIMHGLIIYSTLGILVYTLAMVGKDGLVKLRK